MQYAICSNHESEIKIETIVHRVIMMDARDYPIWNLVQVKELAIALKEISTQILHYEYLHESFGSWFLTVRREGQVYRVVFDGKDGVYSLELSGNKRSPYQWERTIWQHRAQSDEIPIQAILTELIATPNG
jgi:hypothetical protein